VRSSPARVAGDDLRGSAGSWGGWLKGRAEAGDDLRGSPSSTASSSRRTGPCTWRSAGRGRGRGAIWCGGCRGTRGLAELVGEDDLAAALADSARTCWERTPGDYAPGLRSSKANGNCGCGGRAAITPKASCQCFEGIGPDVNASAASLWCVCLVGGRSCGVRRRPCF
jgi:hypothetical protein